MLTCKACSQQQVTQLNLCLTRLSSALMWFPPSAETWHSSTFLGVKNTAFGHQVSCLFLLLAIKPQNHFDGKEQSVIKHTSNYY